jgi:hypothetical protein
MSRLDRPKTSLGIAFALIASALLLYLPPARAAVGYKLKLTFGSTALVLPTDLTIDQANRNVYVTDSGASDVVLFGQEGEGPAGGFVTPITGPAELPFHFGNEVSAVAIDESSGGPSSGDLYVSDGKDNVVDKFKLTSLGEYTYVCRFVGYGRGCEKEPASAPSWVEPDGVAVDSHGNVYIASYEPGEGAVYEFNSEGQDVREFSGGNIKHPVGVVVDTAGDLYVNNFQNNIVKIDPTGHELLLDAEGSGSRAIAVDSRDNVYVDNSTSVVVYDEIGKEINRFGEGGFAPSEGIAVNDETGDVYVSDRSSHEIEVFSPVTVPTVTAGGSSEAKGTTAKVAGSVNPEGIEAHYLVEYGPCINNRLARCSESPYSERTTETALPEPSGTNPEPVAIELTGLSPETTYHYRLVGTNANGDNPGEEATLTTGPVVAGLSTTFASGLQPASATLNGLLDPEGELTHYFFEYVSEAQYNPGAPNPYAEGVSTEGEPGERSGDGEEAASTSVTGLEFGTTYHYRIVAYNEHGVTHGPDHTMTTLPALPIVDDLRPSFATGVGYHEAVLRGTVNPGRGVTTYTFLYGASSVHEFSTPGVYTQANNEDDQVEQAISGLRPDTLYHYVLLATNATGTAASLEGEFTTLAEAAEPAPEGGAGGSQPAAGSPLTQPVAPTLLPVPSFPAIQPLPSGPHQVGCKRGFVRKHGRCVKKKATKKAAPHRKRLSR